VVNQEEVWRGVFLLEGLELALLGLPRLQQVLRALLPVLEQVLLAQHLPILLPRPHFIDVLLPEEGLQVALEVPIELLPLLPPLVSNVQ